MKMSKNLPNPLGGPPPAEIQLSANPLVRVLAQVMLPGIIKIGTQAEASRFQEKVRRDYPLFKEESTTAIRIVLGAGGSAVPSQDVTPVWRFSDAEERWRISLTPNFVVLESMVYTNRVDFINRLSAVLKTVEELFDPQITSRIGIRYIDQVEGDALAKIETMVRPGMLGLAGRQTRAHMLHGMSEALMTADEGNVLLRWGILPANVVIDPTLMAPRSAPSWVLDIDTYSTENRRFDHAALTEDFRSLARRSYTVFRYVVTDEFLKFFGGSL